MSHYMIVSRIYWQIKQNSTFKVTSSLIKNNPRVKYDDSQNSFCQVSKLPSNFSKFFSLPSISVESNSQIHLWNIGLVPVANLNYTFTLWKSWQNWTSLHRFSKQCFLEGSRNQSDHSHHHLSLFLGYPNKMWL